MSFSVNGENSLYKNISASRILNSGLQEILIEAVDALVKDFSLGISPQKTLSKYEALWYESFVKLFQGDHHLLYQNPASFTISSRFRSFFLFPSENITGIYHNKIHLITPAPEYSPEFQEFSRILFRKKILNELPISSVSGRAVEGEDQTIREIFEQWVNHHGLFSFRVFQKSRLPDYFFYNRIQRFLFSIEMENSHIGRKNSEYGYQRFLRRCRRQKRTRIVKNEFLKRVRYFRNFIADQNHSLPVFSLAVIAFIGIVTSLGYSGTIERWSQPVQKSTEDLFYSELISPSWMAYDKGLPESPFLESLGNLFLLELKNKSRETLSGIFWPEKDFNNKLVLTFDDGPNLELLDPEREDITVTEAILDILKQQNIQAVFFINGKNLEFSDEKTKAKLKKILYRTVREGHLLGNHSYHHYNLAMHGFHDGINDFDEIRNEFQMTQDRLEELLGFSYPLVMVRPPFAEPGRSDTLDLVLKQSGQYLISLQFDSYDYAYSRNGRWQYDPLMDHLKSLVLPSRGGVVLMHELATSVKLLNRFVHDPAIVESFSFSDLRTVLENKYCK